MMGPVDPTTWLDCNLTNGTTVTLDQVHDDNACSFAPSNVKDIMNMVAREERKDIITFLASAEGLELLATKGVNAVVDEIKKRGDPLPKLHVVKS